MSDTNGQAQEQAQEERPVWGRGRVCTNTCPKSFITAESKALLEEYLAWKRIGGVSYLVLDARASEAFAILDLELGKEHSEQLQRHQSITGEPREFRTFGE
jgi:hypothetical protein